MRLVRISRREQETSICLPGHTSHDAPCAGESSLLKQLAAPVAEPSLEFTITGPALERLQISPMGVQQAQKRPLAALRLQLVGAGSGPQEIPARPVQ